MKKYWSLFGILIVFVALLVDLNPDYTFINKAADSIGYAYSAKYLYPSYHTSPPFYLLVSHLFLQIPFGTDTWRMGLFSLLSTVGACYFIYLILRKLLPESKFKNFYLFFAILMYGTSALVISQSTIIQTYPLTCMLASGAYYFAISKKWKLMALMVGIGLAVHLLMGFVFVILLVAYKEYRTNWKALLISLSFGVFYIYIPLTNRPPFMWFPDPQQVNSIWAFITDTASTILWLIGKLSIWDLPKRILDTIGLLLVSIAVLSIIPVFMYFRGIKWHRSVLFYLIIVPIVLFVTELDMNTYDYTMLAIPFLTIVTFLGLAQLNKKYLTYGVGLCILGFGIFNVNYFDIGRTLDPNMSASKLYYNEFSKIPDNSIVMPNYAWEWEAVYKYNADYNKHLYPVCMDILPSPMYRNQIMKDGVKLVPSDNPNTSIASRDMARSIVSLNEIYITISTNPSTFGSKVVNAEHDTSLVAGMTEEILNDVALHPKVAWKPYNPYDIITTSIMVTEWNSIILSNWNVMFFGGFAAIGMILWLLVILPRIRNEGVFQEKD